MKDAEGNLTPLFAVKSATQWTVFRTYGNLHVTHGNYILVERQEKEGTKLVNYSYENYLLQVSYRMSSLIGEKSLKMENSSK